MLPGYCTRSTPKRKRLYSAQDKIHTKRMRNNSATERVTELHQQYLAFGEQQPPYEALVDLRHGILGADGLTTSREHSLYGQICLEMATILGDPAECDALLDSSEQCFKEAVSLGDPKKHSSADLFLAHLPKYRAQLAEGRNPGMEEEKLTLDSLRQLAGRIELNFGWRTADFVERQELACHIVLGRTNLRSGEILASSWPALTRQRQGSWTVAASKRGFLGQNFMRLNTAGGEPLPKTTIKQVQVRAQRGGDMSMAFLQLVRLEHELQQNLADPVHGQQNRSELAERSLQLDKLSKRALYRMGISYKGLSTGGE